MSFRLKIDVLSELKKAGYSTYRLRKEKIFSESTIQEMRKGVAPSYNMLAKLCQLLQLQPGDILEFVPDDEQ